MGYLNNSKYETESTNNSAVVMCRSSEANVLQDWGMDIAMGTLLLAAFFSINLLSLVYLAMIAIGMAVPAQQRRVIWRFCVLPVLALLLIAQYSFFIGLPPPFDRESSLDEYMRRNPDGRTSWLTKRRHTPDADSVKASQTFHFVWNASACFAGPASFSVWFCDQSGGHTEDPANMITGLAGLWAC